MKTQRRILTILSAVGAAGIALLVALVASLGLSLGAATFALVLVLSSVAYQQVLRPWHVRWGATDEEAHAPMPGDGLVPHGSGTTRAITIGSPAAEVWPWLVQIGWGRGGWYSYDWVDNDGQPSATRIVPELQDLAPGDRIPMTPALGFVVVDLVPGDHLVARSDDDSTSWCLQVRDLADGSSRLVSRFRAPAPRTAAALAWLMITDPGSFVMERRMLKGIRARAEAARRRATAGPRPAT